jgi:glycopeptide antibiotics resistance protein
MLWLSSTVYGVDCIVSSRVLKHWVPSIARVLLTGYILGVLYGTLHPFEFNTSGKRHGGARKEIEWIPLTRVCPQYGVLCPGDMWDRGLNLAMFMPVGGLLMMSRFQRRSWRLEIRAVTLIGFSLSLAIETAQWFVPSRFSSATDLLLNTVGTLVGAWIVSAAVSSSEGGAGWRRGSEPGGKR